MDHLLIAALRRVVHTAAVVLLLSASFPARAAEIGFNKFELVQQYLGTASAGDGSERYRKVTVAMARKSMADARDVGVTFFRASATGYTPSSPGSRGDLDAWLSNPARHWAQVDLMMADLDAAGLRLVPTFIWNARQFPALAGETVRDLVVDPKSQSYQLAVRYIREFVGRYRRRPTILFYELTNEMNLLADLDLAGRCTRQHTNQPRGNHCSTEANFSTQELIAFTSRLATVIRQVDPSRRISSGYDVPRRAAEHLRAVPEWSQGGPDWTADSREQLQRNLVEIHENIDIISVHLYPGTENTRFGNTDPASASLLEEVHRIARRAGKPLFVGEFSDGSLLDARPDAFTARMLGRIVELNVDYSAYWTWQFYQNSLSSTRDTPATKSSLEPGIADGLLRKIRQAAGKSAAPVAARNDTTPPRLVLTWPLECAKVTSTEQKVHALASDDSGAVRAVEVLVDGTAVATLTNPPFEAVVNVRGLAPGEHLLTVRASDLAGNVATSGTNILVEADSGVRCARSFPQ